VAPINGAQAVSLTIAQANGVTGVKLEKRDLRLGGRGPAAEGSTGRRGGGVWGKFSLKDLDRRQVLEERGWEAFSGKKRRKCLDKE